MAPVVRSVGKSGPLINEDCFFFFFNTLEERNRVSSILTPELFVCVYYQQSDLALVYSQKKLLEFSELV